MPRRSLSRLLSVTATGARGRSRRLLGLLVVFILVVASPTLANDSREPRLLSGAAAGAVDTQGDARFKNWVYYTSARGSEVGVWQGHGRARGAGDAPALTRDDYSELMFIVEGSVTLAEPGLPPLVLSPGDAVIVPRGVPYYWRLAETQWVKKYYVIFDKSEGPVSARYSHIVRLPPRGARDGAVDTRRGGDGKITFYETASGERAGLFAGEAASGTEPAAPHANAEVAFLLAGAGALALSGGGSLPVKAGDVVFAPKGAAFAWRGKDVVAYWVDFDGATETGRPPPAAGRK